jgi:outer membrane immunogenic protein
MQKLSFKIYLLLLCLLTQPAIVYANHFYVGIGGGPEAVDFNQSARISVPGTLLVNDNAHVSGTGLFASLVGGYAWLQNCFHLAAEANLDLSNVKNEHFNNDFTDNAFSSLYYRMPYSFGLSLLPGYIFNVNTLFYARVGLAIGFLKASSSDISIPNVNQKVQGVAFGLGIAQTFSEHFAGRMEYRQVNYQDGTARYFNPLTNFKKVTHIAPTSRQVVFELIYNV